MTSKTLLELIFSSRIAVVDWGQGPIYSGNSGPFHSEELSQHLFDFVSWFETFFGRLNITHFQRLHELPRKKNSGLMLNQTQDCWRQKFTKWVVFLWASQPPLCPQWYYSSSSVEIFVLIFWKLNKQIEFFIFVELQYCRWLNGSNNIKFI